MATTRKMIRRWLVNMKNQGYSHMIVAADTFDYSDYPIGVHAKDVHERLNHIRSAPMSRIMEVYDLNMDFEEQLNEHRAYNLP